MHLISPVVSTRGQGQSKGGTPCPLRFRSRGRNGFRQASALFPVVVLLAGSVSFACQAAGLAVGWTNNMLTVAGPSIPGGKVDIWYLEAFCRSGSTHRDWHQTTIPHKTELLQADSAGKLLRLRTRVEPNIEVAHEIRARADEVDFRLELENKGEQDTDVQWFQPCIKVGR